MKFGSMAAVAIGGIKPLNSVGTGNLIKKKLGQAKEMLKQYTTKWHFLITISRKYTAL